MFSLEGRTALVTGASRGIGREIALAFARAGANLALVARGREALERVACEIRQERRTADVYPFDISAIEDIPALFSRIVAGGAVIDILVNVAGINYRVPAVDYPLSEWRRVLDVNLTAPFVLAQSMARELIRKKRPGKIINIASLLSEAARQNIPAYAASKGGIRQLTKALAVEWAPYRINVNAIGPGYVATELTQPLKEDVEFDQWVKSRTPMGRWAAPSELTGAAVFLASAASDFVTGQIIYVDGGWLANL